MSTLQIEEPLLRTIYKASKPAMKKQLEKKYGRTTFIKPTPPPDTWEGICKIKKWHPVNTLPFPLPKNKDEQALNAFYVISKVRELYNTDEKGKVWEPDWANSNEPKHYPWFEYKAGAGFRFFDSSYVYTTTIISSRLVFRTRELSDRAGKMLEKWYNMMFTL